VNPGGVKSLPKGAAKIDAHHPPAM
jgi:hypothetical protein